MLVQAAFARLKVERCLKVLWLPGHCGLVDNEQADEEVKFGPAERQPPVALDPATRRALMQRACNSNFSFTPPHTSEVHFSKNISCYLSSERPTFAASVVATDPHYDVGQI